VAGRNLDRDAGAYAVALPRAETCFLGGVQVKAGVIGVSAAREDGAGIE
jgi:hypothetical protein